MEDLIFWTLVFVAMFCSFRWLQKRKRRDDD